MKKLIRKTACVQDPLNDFKKKAGITDDNEALFIAALIVKSFLDKGLITDVVENFKQNLVTENIKITRR